MDTFIHLLIDYGYAGMFIAAFLAGSVFPFSSEVVMGGLQLAGLSAFGLIVWGTLGNTLGSLFNYGLGSLGKVEYITKRLGIKQDKMDKSIRWVERYGAWMGFLAWIPLLGSAITIAMGLMRTNPYISIFSIFIGKLVRYLIVVELISQI